MYVVWIKIDETLPWIELEGEHQTKADAKKAAKTILKRAKIKIMQTQRKTKPIKILTTVKR